MSSLNEKSRAGVKPREAKEALFWAGKGVRRQMRQKKRERNGIDGAPWRNAICVFYPGVCPEWLEMHAKCMIVGK